MDWGSAKPFCVSWYAVVQDDMEVDRHVLPRGALVNYREWYGMKKDHPDEGLRMQAKDVAAGIVSRETLKDGSREKIVYGVLDPAAWNVVSGPSIAETLITNKVLFRRADNIRVSRDRRMGGWDQLRARLQGNDWENDGSLPIWGEKGNDWENDGSPMLFFFDTCTHIIRTLPIMTADEHHLEDVDTKLEDHAVDTLRYGCMSRPYAARVVKTKDLDPFLVANAFKLGELQ
jgi:hypothetical protein